ncbi:M57 family metalloprotease [Echinicola rosea]|uniref:Peptidase metallopeptidase domain-containing protein n=2 Tax=Echinicola rosea TaxID=1807691 RepID=A0ABQ1UVK0_9BACT|nr:M57 family metalloprotease [Echinicola rosea]GGF27667.1 hypothetical protein GCM10011339_14700 [Echinicola rosea]
MKGAKVAPFRDGYLIDGDIFISEESLIERFENANSNSKRGNENQQAIANSYNQVSYTIGSTKTITYYIGSSVPSVWETAISDAISEWNNVKNLAFNFVESSSPSADLSFTTYNEVTSTIAFADFPSSGEPGDQISINTYYNSNTRLSTSRKKFTIAHEMGHALGFRHTNWQQRNEPVNDPSKDIYGANLVAGTWNEDAVSVMNGTVSDWNGFSFLDILAFRTVYPLDDNLKPCYVYRRLTNKGYYWTTDWSEYGSYTYDSPTSTGFEYIGFNGFMYETQVSGTVPIYLYYSPGSNWYNKSKDPYIDSNFQGWNKIGIIGYAYAAAGAGRQPVHQYFHPSKGFFNTLNYNDDFVASDPNWSYNGIPYYAASVY